MTGATYPDGFVYTNFYGQQNCAGPVVAAAGHPTNKCIITYQDHDSATPTGSVIYTCNGGKGFLFIATPLFFTFRSILVSHTSLRSFFFTHRHFLHDSFL